MNRTGQIIVIAILVLLVVMFGVGEFFAGPVNVAVAPASTSSDATNGGATAASGLPSGVATQIVQYTPSTPATSTPVVQGSCWTNSLAAPFRGDAWRGMVGAGISDPCFQIPGQPKLLCGADPADPQATSTFVLALTKPLPPPQPAEGIEPAGYGWLLELQGGTRCSPFTGTMPVTADGESPSWGCAPGPLGKDIMIFAVDTSSTPWTAEVGTIAPAPANSISGMPVVAVTSSVPIATIWQ